MDQRYFLKSRFAKKILTQARSWNPLFLVLALRMEPPMPDMRSTGFGSEGSRPWIRLRRKQGKRRKSPSIFEGEARVRVRVRVLCNGGKTDTYEDERERRVKCFRRGQVKKTDK